MTFATLFRPRPVTRFPRIARLARKTRRFMTATATSPHAAAFDALEALAAEYATLDQELTAIDQEHAAILKKVQLLKNPQGAETYPQIEERARQRQDAEAVEDVVRKRAQNAKTALRTKEAEVRQAAGEICRKTYAEVEALRTKFEEDETARLLADIDPSYHKPHAANQLAQLHMNALEIARANPRFTVLCNAVGAVHGAEYSRNPIPEAVAAIGRVLRILEESGN